MTSDALLDALQLPASARVDKRVAKSLLTEHGAPTAADKRLILDGIDEVRWVATCRPNTVAVAEFHDGERDYIEIAVLAVTLRREARISRLVELVHRAVPHPVLLVCDGAGVRLSVAHKRKALNELDKVVLDGDVVEVAWPDPAGGVRDSQLELAFLGSLALARQPAQSLLGVVQGWVAVLWAMQAARLTGELRLPATQSAAAERVALLAECRRLDAEVARLRADGQRERQLSRMVEINMEIQRLQAATLAAVGRL